MTAAHRPGLPGCPGTRDPADEGGGGRGGTTPTRHLALLRGGLPERLGKAAGQDVTVHLDRIA